MCPYDILPPETGFGATFGIFSSYRIRKKFVANSVCMIFQVLNNIQVYGPLMGLEYTTLKP